MTLALVLGYFVASGTLSLGLLALVWLADRYEREPLGLVLATAAWGTIPAFLLSCVTEFAVQLPLSAVAGEGEAGEALMAILVAPPVEEAAKAMALLALVLLARREFDDVMDGMVYGAAVGVGFSFVEDLVYFIGALGSHGAGAGVVTFALRNLAFMLNHSLFTALTGIGFGLARVYHRRKLDLFLWPVAGYLAATALHSLHNFLASLDLPGLLGAMYLHLFGGLGIVILTFFTWEVERRWILRWLGQEVAEGRIPPGALAALPFVRRPGLVPRGRAAELRAALMNLAFHRRQVDEGWAPEAASELEPFREKIRGCFRA